MSLLGILGIILLVVGVVIAVTGAPLFGAIVAAVGIGFLLISGIPSRL